MAKKIMITGVNGLIAGANYKHLAAQENLYEVYGLARRRMASARVAEGKKVTIPENRFVLADLSDPEALNGAFEGMDVVVHMAAIPDADAPWEWIHQSNVQGACHVFEACKQNGVQRIVYASTVWGEALAYKYSQEGLSSRCLRIGWMNNEDACTRVDLGSVWCSQRDIIQLTERCINAPEDLMFDIFYGSSDNRLRWVDIDHAGEVVGYQPKDGYGHEE